VAPSGSTLRRVVEDIDTDAADLLVCQWIAQRARPRRAGDSDGDGPVHASHGLAMDGKTVRRSGAGNPDANVKLFSAMLHEQAVVIAQIRVPDTTTEVTQVAELLDPVNLAGALVGLCYVVSLNGRLQRWQAPAMATSRACSSRSTA
jgi:hypothetical protein